MFWYSIVKTKDKKRLENLKVYEWVKLNLDILKQWWPEFIRELNKNIQLLQNDLIKKSLKVRSVEWLAYFDWASDFAEKLKFELKQVINKLVINPNTNSPITGKKLKTWKKR